MCDKKNSSDINQFKKDTEQLGIKLTEKQVDQFIEYYEMLAESNKVMNLTAITEFRDVLKKHFVDSLTLIKEVDLTKKWTIMDVGTGAGFPGLALKIAFPELKVTLLDSLNKRVQFLNKVIEKLELTDIEALHGRAEDYAKADKLREKFDICVSRAVANLSTLSEYCLPYVKEKGYFIPYKSEKGSEEIKNAEKALQILGGKVIKEDEFLLPDSDITRKLVVIRKIRKTPEKYPRKAGLPSKNPL